VGTNNRIALAVRIRNEWPLLRGLLASLAGACDEAWILDDASEDLIPPALLKMLPRVTVLRAERWSGEGGRFGEGEQRDHLLQRIKRGSTCGWILQLDADERLDRPRAVRELASRSDVDGWILPLVDYYITPEDEHVKDELDPGRVRSWHGIETRWTMCLFRTTRWLYVSRGDVREPQGLSRSRVARSSDCTIEHFGKSVSVAEFERKANFYVEHYPHYREKWMARRGGAVHAGVSDFGTPLVRRGDPAFSPAMAPVLHEYRVERGIRALGKRFAYGLLAPSLRSVSTAVTPVAE
jgi:hypothetical protein